MGSGRWEVDQVDKRDGKNQGNGQSGGSFRARGNNTGFFTGAGGQTLINDIVVVHDPGGWWAGGGLTLPAGLWVVTLSGVFVADADVGAGASPGHVTTLLNADGFEGNWAAAGAETCVFEGEIQDRGGDQKFFPLVTADEDGTWTTLLLSAHRY